MAAVFTLGRARHFAPPKVSRGERFVAIVALVLVASGRAVGAAEQGVVIPPGQEALLGQMLGLGADLPEGCTFATGQIGQSAITVTYVCPGGEVVIDLGQRDTAAARAAHTDKFDVSVRRGSPPAALIDALRSRIRAREDGFTWVVPTPATPAFGAAAPGWVTAGAVFYAAVVAGVAIAFWRSRRRIATSTAVLPLALTVLALALRWIAHGGPADIRSVLGDLRPSRGGWVAFTHLAFAVLPPIDETIWAINRVAGALAVPLLYAAMRKRFQDPIAAVAAAAALAMTPLIVRFSASDTPYTLLCAAFLGAIVAYDRYVETESAAVLALSLGLLTAAMQLRPDASWLILPAALIALARPAPGWASRLRRPGAVICAALFIAINAVPIIVSVTDNVGGYGTSFAILGSTIGSPWAVPAMTPRSLAALVAIGIPCALLTGRPGLAWLAAMLIADPFDFPADAPAGHYANARYHLPAMYLACGLVGLGIAGPLRLIERVTRHAVPAKAPIAIAVVLLAAAPRADLLWRMWTPQREFEFFRAGLARVDADCRVITLERVSDAGFVPFDYLRAGGVLDIGEFFDEPREGCAVYYRAANCYSSSLQLAPPDFLMHPACRAIEAAYRLDPIVEAEIPAAPYRDERYVRDALPVGFYRLEPRPATDPVSRSRGAPAVAAAD